MSNTPCPRGKTNIDFDTCMSCVNDNTTEDGCGACELVYDGIAPFTCDDCENETCILSGNKTPNICPNCKRDIPPGTGYWKKGKYEDTLYCSEICAKKK